MASLNVKRPGTDVGDQTVESSSCFRILCATDPDGLRFYSSQELRSRFLIDDLFKPGRLQMVYSEQDRVIIGSAVPASEAIFMEAHQGLRTAYFTERREVGIINLGGPGMVAVDGNCYTLDARDGLYIGRGNRSVCFTSRDATSPAAFYIVSYPAHASYPVRLVTKQDAEHVELGEIAASNRRHLYKYIHPGGVQSCQLVMGLTELVPGSVWNTMPVHTHQRRSEVYLYFDLPNDQVVMHCLGRPNETRHVMVRNRQAVLSPSWSIHAGAGT